MRKRVSVFVIHENKILGFYAEDPYNHKKYFFLPGGLIEENETHEQTAIRETLEETGYSIEILKHITPEHRHYDFEWNGKNNDCDTHFFAGRLTTTKAKEINDADYHRGVAWQPIKQTQSPSKDLITEIFSYHKDILEPIIKLIKAIQEGQK